MNSTKDDDLDDVVGKALGIDSSELSILNILSGWFN